MEGAGDEREGDYLSLSEQPGDGVGVEGEGEADDDIRFPELATGDEREDDDYFSLSTSSSPFASALDRSLASSLASRSSCFSLAESSPQDGWDHYPPISECEEIASLRWLSRLWTLSSKTRSPPAYAAARLRDEPAAYREKLASPDIEAILSRAVAPVCYSSWEDLYVRLCCSILIDGGSKSFALDRSTGKKCYLLSAGELQIDRDDRCYRAFFYTRTAVPPSRFTRVAWLWTVWWSAIHAEVQVRTLSPRTTYVALLVFTFSAGSFGKGLFSEEQEAAVTVGSLRRTRPVFLQPSELQRRRAAAGVPRRRVDGWLELEMGEFDVAGDGEKLGAVRVSLERREVHYDDESILDLLVEGVELRPKGATTPRKLAQLQRLWRG